VTWRRLKTIMTDIFLFLAFMGVYLLLQIVVLPRLGFQT
jgi:hypothetical protein